ncbi:hypothetical protein BCY86_03975 [Pajaroellobacter abortibovis]|uniref:Uncharacterized protein n=1 Tax=Pajaroellobacter abortibovis TaxID=1882918 RepID=A0A1L6MWJ9_9BACT|nr:hypothetical protein BCY86_03975 [Pajaroellobacter abortibovis]
MGFIFIYLYPPASLWAQTHGYVLPSPLSPIHSTPIPLALSVLPLVYSFTHPGYVFLYFFKQVYVLLVALPYEKDALNKSGPCSFSPNLTLLIAYCNL